MQVREFQAPAVLPPSKEPPVSTGLDSGWAQAELLIDEKLLLNHFSKKIHILYKICTHKTCFNSSYVHICLHARSGVNMDNHLV
jgi:hypothetical protein